MYRKHLLMLVVIVSITGMLAWFLKMPYVKIASDAIVVVSIAIAVYLTAVTLLIGSKIAESMKHQDQEIPTKTKMGVLITYLNRAIIVGALSITDSCISKMYCDKDLLLHFPIIYYTISTIGFTLFAMTIFFMWIIFKFIAASILKS